MTDKPQSLNNTDKLSPCELIADRGGYRDVVNFIPRDNGALQRIEAKRNAVIFDFHEHWEDGERVLKRFVSIECKDMDMKDELIKMAHELLERINRND